MFNSILIRTTLSIKTTLAVSTLLGGYYLYFNHLPSSLDVLSWVGLCLLVMTASLFFTFGRWEQVILVLIPICFSSNYLSNGLVNTNSAIFPCRLIALGMVVDLLSSCLQFSFRRSSSGRLLGTIPRSYLLIFNIIATGFIVLGMVSFFPAINLQGHLLTLVWMLGSILLSLAIFPLATYFFEHQRKESQKYPYTFRLLARTAFAYGLFITGCLFLTAQGFILFSLFPSSKVEIRRKYFYHQTIKWFCRILVLATTRGLTIIDHNKAPFDKPSIIIVNHQSFIDLIVMLSLHPRLILLTNDWVWNSPLFGRVVRWAEYYPVSSGIEDSVENLREAVAGGYSVVVFPEGSRSKDMSIKRFKKGAFYLAEKLDLDILPIALHGTGEGITKQEFIFKKTSLNALILPKIEHQSPQFAKGYSERCKQISAYFKEEYAKLKTACETPVFLTRRLFLNYAYQGYAALASIKSMNRRYQDFLPYLFNLSISKGILHIGSNHGEITCLLHFRFPGLAITGLEQDKLKLCISLNAKSHIPANKLNYRELEAVLLIDHDYDLCLVNLDQLPEEEQKTKIIFQNCMDQLQSNGTMIIYYQNQNTLDRYRELFLVLADQALYRELPSISQQVLIFQKIP